MKRISHTLILAAVLLLAVFICPVAAENTTAVSSGNSVPDELFSGPDTDPSAENNVFADTESMNTSPALMTARSVAAVSFSGGSGTESDPYIITTPEQLDAVRNDLAAHYRLGAAIDLSGYDNWVPIGNYNYGHLAFTGSLDGDGHIISNLYSWQPMSSDSGAGLFASIKGATLSDITLSNVNISGGYHVGALVGGGTSRWVYETESYIPNTIENCHVLYGTAAGYGRVGGIAGLYGGIIRSSCADVIVSGVYNDSSAAGGLIGYGAGDIYSPLIVDNCSVSGIVSAPDLSGVGGLIGLTYEGSFTNSFATGQVDGGQGVGGLIGMAYSGNNSISNCFATGNVFTTGENSGGLLGYTDHVSVNNSYATGDVFGGRTVGGLVGGASNCQAMEYCYAIGNVTGSDVVGGLVGSISSCPSLTGCVALNPYVNTTDSSIYQIGRISGSQYNVTPVNCSAWIDIGTNREYGLSGGGGLIAYQPEIWDTFGSTGVWENWDPAIWKLPEDNADYRLPVLQWQESTEGFAAPHLAEYSYPELRLRALTGDETNLISVDGKEVKTSDPFVLIIDSQAGGSPMVNVIFTTPSGGKTTSFGEMSCSNISLNRKSTPVPCILNQAEPGTYTATAYYTYPEILAQYAPQSNEISFTIVESIIPVPDFQGSGTVSSPYLITSPEDLALLSDSVGNGTSFRDTHFRLANDIDLSGYENWKPVGTFYSTQYNDTDSWNTEWYNQFVFLQTETPFSGIFDGAGHSIRNLSLNVSGYGNTTSFVFMENVGLFGLVTDSVLTNLSIENMQIVAYWSAGGLAGSASDSVIDNCSTTGYIKAGNGLGALIGNAFNTTISRCSIDATVDGGPGCNIGGMIGQAIGNSTLTRCSAEGNVTGQAQVGGLVGQIGGFMQDDGVCSITDCYFAGNLIGTSDVGGPTIGGIAGSVDGTNITRCYTVGTISTLISGTQPLSANYGGLVGPQYSGSVEDSVALMQYIQFPGDISELHRVAAYSRGILDNNHAWDGMHDTHNPLPAGNTSSIDGASVTSEEIWNNPAFYTKLGWNFGTVWTMGTSADYRLPVLRNQPEPAVDASYLAPENWLPENSITLIPRWNFISVSKTLAPGNNTAEVLFGGLDTGGRAPLAYDANTSQWYSVSGSEIIRPQNGYWIYTTAPSEIQLVFPDTPGLPAAKILYPGWNAIGLASDYPTPAANALAGTSWRTLLPWNVAAGVWDPAIINGGTGGNSAERMMTTGNGYWLYVTEGGVFPGLTA